MLKRVLVTISIYVAFAFGVAGLGYVRLAGKALGDNHELLFGLRTIYVVEGRPTSVFSADFDGDGDNDLVVSDWANSAVWILMNNGDGTFSPPVGYTSGSAMSVFSVDLDMDGDNDLAVATSGDAISVLLNNGDGTFAAPVDYPVESKAYSISSADLDGDGDNDLAVTGGGYTVSVLMNNGDGTFVPPVLYRAGDRPGSISIADLDRDGDNDLAVTDWENHSVLVFMNNGDGTFAPPVGYPVGRYPISISITDLDGDGDNDLVSGNQTGFVSVLSNNGDGTFAAPVDYPAGDDCGPVSIADLDGDRDYDLAVVGGGWRMSNTVSVLLNSGDGTFAAKVDYDTGWNPTSVFSIDLDRDEDYDIVTVSRNEYGIGPTVSVLLNQSIVISNTIPPYTINFQPEENSTDIDPDTDIYLEVKDDTGVDKNSLEMIVNGVKVEPVITPIEDGFSLLYDPPTDLGFGETVTVAVSASDLHGNSMSEEYSFTTADQPDFSIELNDIRNLPEENDRMTKAEDLKIIVVIKGKNLLGEKEVNIECSALNKLTSKTVTVGTHTVTLSPELDYKAFYSFYTNALPRIFEGTIIAKVKEADAVAENNEVRQDVNIYYTPFEFGRDNYSFANSKSYAQDYSIKDIIASLSATSTGTTKGAIITPLYYFLGILTTFFSEQGGYCYGFAATSILYRDHPEIRVHGKDDITYSYNEDDTDVRYKIKEYFKNPDSWVETMSEKGLVEGW